VSKDILKKHGMKATLGRLEILNLFSQQGCAPMDAESVYKKLKRKSMDLVTVYRTVTSFEKKKILKRVDLHKDSVYYELADHHHHHIVCTTCGLIEGFEMCNIAVVSKKVLSNSSKFNIINEHSLEFFGVCTSCYKN
jgi:Fur family transcriptional regulator, ferric uptake regulator